MSVGVTPSGLEHVLEVRRYFAQALDPIHVGTGGERLSRVDMSIIREAGTDLPKLPGTSLSGACRAYAALQRKDGERGRYCAGQQGEEHEEVEGGNKRKVKEHCGKPDCPICQTFGYAKGSSNGTSGGNGGNFKKGVAQFADAHIIAFPVASSSGPIWVTCTSALKRIGYDAPAVSNDKVRIADRTGKIALGWLALDVEGAFALPPDLQQFDKEKAQMGTAALVADNLFSTIVNDNLEVRTSVSINPLTGAADDGALFTYEAIPTGTLFAFDVTYQPRDWQHQNAPDMTPQQTVQSGLQLFAWLGVGGMNTRGMGRLKVSGLEG